MLCKLCGLEMKRISCIEKDDTIKNKFVCRNKTCPNSRREIETTEQKIQEENV